ncbi:hypothetical protein BCF74_10211 [Knoellia remsis]|uniref:Uncharacterized protein n=1 Tax=Knoellia remsis TaxID=407159 RepID=A0A2T0UZ17_9MICO|nr:hypothetical protein [Knoellia remsis]PRY63180.1 hypothetical protein BCF74_10211 [Knoellia remsis]
MRVRDFWRSAFSDDTRGWRYVMAMFFVWVPLGMFGAMAILGDEVWWDMLGWVLLAGLGWVIAWTVILRIHRRSEPGATVDLTPWRPLAVPNLMMVAGFVGCFLSVR